LCKNIYGQISFIDYELSKQKRLQLITATRKTHEWHRTNCLMLRMRISEEDGKNKLYLWLSIYNKKFEKKLQQKTSNTTAKDDMSGIM